VLASSGPCDYLLFINRRTCGVVEAKPEGQTLTGVADQSTYYMAALPSHLQSWAPNLLFDYESTGAETLFRDLRESAQLTRVEVGAEAPASRPSEAGFEVPNPKFGGGLTAKFNRPGRFITPGHIWRLRRS